MTFDGLASPDLRQRGVADLAPVNCFGLPADPVVAMAVALERYIRRGMMIGAVKG